MLKFTLTESGFYNVGGFMVSLDELIESYEKEGYRAIRSYENQRVYLKDENGNIKEEFQMCEVVRFK